MSRKTILSFSLFWIIMLNAHNLLAITIDLNTFNASPPSAINVSPNGILATFFEDQSVSPVTLEKIDLFIPLDAAALSFDYKLTVASDNEDYFDFFIGDLSSPAFETGGFEGVYSEAYSHNLQGFIGDSVPIIFDFIYGWNDFGLESTLTIRNVAINPIPEPSSLTLILTALLSFGFFIKKKLSLK